jgi:hypothetical protein
MDVGQRVLAFLAGVELGATHTATTSLASDKCRPTHRNFRIGRLC